MDKPTGLTTSSRSEQTGLNGLKSVIYGGPFKSAQGGQMYRLFQPMTGTNHLIIKLNQGKVPDSMAELTALPGVARKTANIVLSSGYGKIEGVAVDTHVKRLSLLHGLTKQKNPDKIEQDLMEVFPKKEWADLNHRLVDYGREYCSARKHDHENCPLEKALKKVR